jgi:hypothetical protein
MKKILVPFIAAFALAAPTSASADSTALDAAAPYCSNGSVFPVGANVRCTNGTRLCTVYAFYNLTVVGGPRQYFCI